MHSTTGSTTLPKDLLILTPSNTSQPWPKICLGSGMSSILSMIGQIIVWKRMISLPTMCLSAGQYFSNSDGSSDA